MQNVRILGVSPFFRRQNNSQTVKKKKKIYTCIRFDIGVFRLFGRITSTQAVQNYCMPMIVGRTGFDYRQMGKQTFTSLDNDDDLWWNLVFKLDYLTAIR